MIEFKKVQDEAKLRTSVELSRPDISKITVDGRSKIDLELTAISIGVAICNI